MTSIAPGLGVLLTIWIGQTSDTRPVVSILTEMTEDLRGELPTEYAGLWMVSPSELPSSGLVVRPDRTGAEKSRRLLCITRDQKGDAVTLRSLEVLDGEARWHVRESGWAFRVDGIVYAYLMNQFTNLAVGRIVRFQGSGETRNLSLLEPNRLRRTLEERGAPFMLYTSQIKVEARRVIEVLRSASPTFEELAVPWSERSSDLPACK